MTHVVRTRFAPSPTGYLHVGGARTALFNYLLARRAGGQFILRIEDTDQSRNVAAADQRLLDDLRWLGLQWDEGPEVGGDHGPYYQSQRLDRYHEHARRLLDDGQAYYAFDTRAELDAMRRGAQQRKENFRYPRPANFPSESQAREARTAGRPVVIRFKMPRLDCVISDSILGEVRIGADEVDDFVIIKADDWPTYHFAVVIDDEQMRVTHVLRGQEHPMNTPNHLALQEAFGYRVPVYAHLPIILNMDGSKMGKREKYNTLKRSYGLLISDEAQGNEQAQRLRLAADAAAGFAITQSEAKDFTSELYTQVAHTLGLELPEIDVHDFRASGYLPEVLTNFIALLGWNPGTQQEKFTLRELCQAFGIERIGKTNARFDRDKLIAFNTDALATATPECKLVAIRDWLTVNEHSPLGNQDDATLAHLIELCAGFRTFPDIDRKCGALFAPDDALNYDADAVKKWLLKGDGLGLKVLWDLHGSLGALKEWSAVEIDEAVRGYATTMELGFGKVAQPLRIAATGTTISPQIGDTLALLGQERTLARIDRLLAHPGSQPARGAL
ncbi:MAG: glutamate--tRNA ligase [Planctomycetota bacterium]